MNKLNTKLSISTFQIFIENVNPDYAGELIVDKVFISDLINELEKELKTMKESNKVFDIITLAIIELKQITKQDENKTQALQQN